MSVLKPFVFLAAFAACTPVCAQQSQEVVSEQASSLENSEQERTVENEENQSGIVFRDVIMLALAGFVSLVILLIP